MSERIHEMMYKWMNERMTEIHRTFDEYVFNISYQNFVAYLF